MKVNIVIGGKAGQGPNVLAETIGKILAKLGYSTFISREYGSFIRGGHNYNILTFADSDVSSNEKKIDILICLDENTKKLHQDDLKKESLILQNPEKRDNMYFAGTLAKILGIELTILEDELRKLKKFQENMKSAEKGYNDEETKFKLKKLESENPPINLSGSQGTSEGAIKSGLDVYYFYPMTPATPLAFELAPLQFENKFLCLELENEIAVAMAALGSAATGAKSMVGTSGGGFDLMTESISMSGQAEIPLVAYLAQRPGPGTGVPTGTSQGDLQLARHSSHGEFSRVVFAPGTPDECASLTSEAFYFSQKFKIPSIILTDKHLSESIFTIKEKGKITPSDKTVSLKRFDSYEHTKDGIATENAKIIRENFIARNEKKQEIKKEAEKFQQYKIYGKENSRNIIISYGSTKGAILDSIKDLDVKFIQVLYIEPFPKIPELEKAKRIILIENSSSGALAEVIREKTGIEILEKNKILKFDSLPFYSDELNPEIKKRLK